MPDGGQCRTRTCDLLLVRQSRTENQQLPRITANCEELRYVVVPENLITSSTAVRLKWSELVTSTRLAQSAWHFFRFFLALRIHTSRLASFLQNGLQPIKAINRHLSPEKWKPSLDHLPVGQNGITFRPATSCSCLVKHEVITGYFEHVKTLWNLLTPSEVSASCLLLHSH